MYLKIKFIFYLIHGITIEEEIVYQKSRENIDYATFEREVFGFEVDFRKELTDALNSKSNRILSFNNTVFSGSSLVAFKTYVETVELETPQNEFFNGLETTNAEPINFTIEEEEVNDNE